LNYFFLSSFSFRSKIVVAIRESPVDTSRVYIFLIEYKSLDKVRYEPSKQEPEESPSLRHVRLRVGALL
jgi:hypothetical protein